MNMEKEAIVRVFFFFFISVHLYLSHSLSNYRIIAIIISVYITM